MTGAVRQIALYVAVAAAAGYVTASRDGTSAAPQARQSAAAASGTLPRLGTQLAALPEGAGKAIAEAGCLSCHSTDILRQQRLTKQQWTGTLTKMSNWGVVLSDADRDVLLGYLVSHFGPENASFQPVAAQPVRR